MKSLVAKGEFEITPEPLPARAAGKADLRLGRMSITKTFEGDLSGDSSGEMLSAALTTEGSAGQVAIEQVEATLQGRSSSFVLQHTGIMNRGEARLTVTIVPDSDVGKLAGLAGTMRIVIKGGKHLYELEYTLP